MPLLPLRDISIVLVVLPCFVEETLKDVLVALAVLLERSDFVPRLTPARDPRVEFGHRYKCVLGAQLLKCFARSFYCMTSESLDADEADRPRGILSEADRKYLLASDDEREANYSRQACSLREREIRKRLRHAMLDLDLILRGLDEGVLKQVFEPEQITSEQITKMEYGLAGAVGVVYYIAEKLTAPGHADEFFEDTIERGVWTAKNMTDAPGSPPAFLQYDVYFEVSKPSIDVHTIAEKVREGRLQELSEPEMRTFLWMYESRGGELASGDAAADEFLDFAKDRLPDHYFAGSAAE